MEEIIYVNGKKFKLIPGKKSHYCSECGLIYSTHSKRLLKQRKFNGYVQVGLGDETYFVHQLVAMTYLGHIRGDRKVHVDHVNNKKDDNRVENLRITTARFNLSRGRGISSNYTGVCWSKQNQNWVSHIRIDGKLKYLGSFKDELKAHLAYIEAKKKLT